MSIQKEKIRMKFNKLFVNFDDFIKYLKLQHKMLEKPT